jgi:hypothetical protein
MLKHWSALPRLLALCFVNSLTARIGWNGRRNF